VLYRVMARLGYKPREVDEMTVDECADALGLDEDAEVLAPGVTSLTAERVRRAEAGLPPLRPAPAVTDPEVASRLRASVGEVVAG
jgi:hypothetical protein